MNHRYCGDNFDYYENHINQNRAFSETQLRSRLKTLSRKEKKKLLFTHATYSDLDLVKMICQEEKIKIKSIDFETGGNCFHFAAKYACYLGNPKENLKFIRFLIQNGVNVNHQDHRGISGFEQHIIEFLKQKNHPEKWKNLNKPQILAMIKAGGKLNHPKAKMPESEKTYEEALQDILNFGKLIQEKQKNSLCSTSKINVSLFNAGVHSDANFSQIIFNPLKSAEEKNIQSEKQNDIQSITSDLEKQRIQPDQEKTTKDKESNIPLHCLNGLASFFSHSANSLAEIDPQKKSETPRKNSCPDFSRSKFKSIRQPG